VAELLQGCEFITTLATFSHYMGWMTGDFYDNVWRRPVSFDQRPLLRMRLGSGPARKRRFGADAFRNPGFAAEAVKLAIHATVHYPRKTAVCVCAGSLSLSRAAREPASPAYRRFKLFRPTITLGFTVTVNGSSTALTSAPVGEKTVVTLTPGISLGATFTLSDGTYRIGGGCAAGDQEDCR